LCYFSTAEIDDDVITYLFTYLLTYTTDQ